MHEIVAGGKVVGRQGSNAAEVQSGVGEGAAPSGLHREVNHPLAALPIVSWSA